MKKMVLLCVALLIIMLIYFSLNRFIKKNIYPVPDDPSVGMIDGGVLIHTQSEGQTAKGLFVKKGDTLLVMFHGNGSTINDLIDIAGNFIQENHSVLLVEYPGYGILNSDKPDEKEIYDRSMALINHVKNEYGYKKIIPLGYSLGAAVAVEMSSRGIGSRLILIAGFTSMDDMIGLNYPKIVGTVFNTEKYESLKKVKNITTETLIIHGENDQSIPFSMAEILLNNMKRARLIPVKNGTHDVFEQMDQQHWEKVLNFVAETR